MDLAIRYMYSNAWKVTSASAPTPLRGLMKLLADATELAAEDDRERLQRRGLRTIHRIVRFDPDTPAKGTAVGTVQPENVPLDY